MILSLVMVVLFVLLAIGTPVGFAMAGSGVLGKTATTSSALASDIGDEVDARVAYKLGVATLYGAASTFVPGNVYAAPGFANAASKLEIGTEVRF